MFRKIVSMLCLMFALITINSFSMEISSMLNIEGNQDIYKDLFDHNTEEVFRVNNEAILEYIRTTEELDKAMVLQSSARPGNFITKRKNKSIINSVVYVCPLCLGEKKPYHNGGSLIGHMQNAHAKKIIDCDIKKTTKYDTQFFYKKFTQ